MPDYRYRGYTLRVTDTIHANSMRPLYEIDGLKPRGTRPFLTTLRECREFIDDHLADEHLEQPGDCPSPLRARRVALGLSLEQLAAATGLKCATLQKYETGIMPISGARASSAVALARALGTTVEQLCEDEQSVTAE